MADNNQTNPRLPVWLCFKLILAAAFLQSRSFVADARSAISRIKPQPDLRGLENIPGYGPCLVTCNHYTRPGLAAWWGPLLISTTVAAHRESATDAEIHWVMTAAWTFPDQPWRRKYLTPMTHWAFDRVAHVYGFITMPPMPPEPEEIYARAVSVRKTLRLAREIAPQGGMIGLAPEGRDTAEIVGSVPEGVGDFISHLCKIGMPVLPAAVSEHNDHLCVSFGPVFTPSVPTDKSRRDKAVTNQVMAAIARLVS
jgi:hypothetical protein